jgi:hypothetical protein
MTDYVGYSQLAIEEKAAANKRLLEAVLECPAIEGLGEEECIRLDSGDGVSLVFFTDPARAIEAAEHLYRKVAEQSSFKLRIGLHSGLVTRRLDANDKVNVSGPGIDKAQRAMSCADGSRIVMTVFFAENLRAFAGWGERLEDLGEHDIKHGEKLRLYGIRNAAIAPAESDVVLLYRRQARPDDELLAMLERRLPDLGHKPFIDRHLKIGVEWAQNIEKRIRSADAVIALISEAALTSEMLEAELEIAADEYKRSGKPCILPIRIGVDEPVTGPLAPYVAALQYGVWRGPEDDDKILGEIQGSLAKPPQPDRNLMAQDTGGLPPDSPFYVERSADHPFRQAIRASESILLIKGPRQIGKTSLLAQGVRSAQEFGYRFAFTDFQKFNAKLLEDENAFYRALSATLARQIGFDYDFDRRWDPIFGSTMNMEDFMRAALESKPRPLVWFMDEADKLFTVPFASDFYGLVRSWHNSRATDTAGPWGRLTIVIAYATEAHLFIQDLNQSPFNVGRPFLLEEFDLPRVAALNAKSASPLKSLDEVAALMDLIGGQPFLVRRALNSLLSGMTLSDLLAHGTRDSGPFADHLKRTLVSISNMPSILAVVRALLKGERPTDQDATYRLLSAGVVVSSDDGELSFRNRLYREYLAEHCL